MLKWLKNLFVESELEWQRRKEHEEYRAKVDPHILELAHLAMELIQLVGIDGGFGNKTRIREIGEELNRIGGMETMQRGFYAVKKAGKYFSQDIWDGIGSWQC